MTKFERVDNVYFDIHGGRERGGEGAREPVAAWFSSKASTDHAQATPWRASPAAGSWRRRGRRYRTAGCTPVSFQTRRCRRFQ